MLGPSAHVDRYSRDRLPPLKDWPEMLLDRPEFQYAEYVNAAVELTDGVVAKGLGDHVAVRGDGESFTYRNLTAESNRIARVLIEDMGVLPGNRVLIRSANNPRMVAAWLGATKAGAVVVNSMPMLRAGELTKIVDKAEIAFALCDQRLAAELKACAASSVYLEKIMTFDGTSARQGELEARMAEKPESFEAVKTGRDDVALLGFTSGSTGVPKATMHFHRDILAIADGYAASVLAPTAEDVFIGSPPLAFTFGLGGLAVFPLRFGATAVLIEDGRPANLLKTIQELGATICFTAPTAYRVMMGEVAEGRGDLSSLRLAVSAGETLPRATFDAWTEATGVPILDGIGATELLHIFITNRPGDIRPGATGKPVPGYDAVIVDDEMKPLPDGEVGKLAVRGPTGCRYLGGDRQTAYVREGWNLTGDAFSRDAEGYFHFAARADDMIVSSGYNIAGPEVEDALLTHPDVAECAVIGADDDERGAVVEAHVVLREGVDKGPTLIKGLQDHVKSVIAPYKYPRSIVFTTALPKTPTGKVQRFKLKAGKG